MTSEEHKKNALLKLNMSEQELDLAVGNLASWITYQPHLPQTIEKTALRSFIVGCKSVEIAKRKLENYFMSRINFPAEVSNRDPTKIQWDKIQPLAYLPNLTPEGQLVLFMTMPNLTEMPQFDFLESLRLVGMMGELVLREQPYSIGQICIVDLKNVSLKIATKLSITNIINSLYLFEEANPFKITAIYCFNMPQAADYLQRTLIRPVVNDEMYNMIISHTGNEDCLKKYVPKKMLPHDYGGEAPPLSQIMKDWQVRLENKKDLFYNELKLLPDPSKISKQNQSNSQFGTSGTFRKLNFD